MNKPEGNPQTLSELDRPNSYIGKSVPRPNLDRLLQGRGLYVSDLELPRMTHVVFVRSPYAHARIVAIDTSALASEGTEVGAAARDRRRKSLLAGRSGGGGCRHQPRGG
jgi:xanthine dehydrogenase molybdopterin-binding subunit B